MYQILSHSQALSALKHIESTPRLVNKNDDNTMGPAKKADVELEDD